MIQKEITICGKQVTLAYCFDTEIEYQQIEIEGKQTSEECVDFIKDVVGIIANNGLPDRVKTFRLILAAANAWYGRGKSPITYDLLKRETTAAEFGEVIGTLFTMYIDFYKIPIEAEEKTDEGEAPKNA